MNENKSFIFYESWERQLLELDEADELLMRRAISAYALGGDVVLENKYLKALFLGFKQAIDDNVEKWEEKKRRRSEAGKKGNEKRWGAKSQDVAMGNDVSQKSQCDTLRQSESQKSQSIANIAVNDNVNVNGNVNVPHICEVERERERDAASAVAEATLSQSTTKDKTRLRKNRENDFYQELIPYVDIYGSDMIRTFFDYWTEPNKSGTKFKKELERTWDTGRRLASWESREQKYGRKNTTATQATDTGRTPYAESIAEIVNRYK